VIAKKKPTKRSTQADREAGRRHSEAANAWAAKTNSAARDVAPVPKPWVANPSRRDACGQSLQLFFETYFPGAFSLAWSPDHLKAIAKIERAVRSGGLFSLAMPRGSGKSTMFRLAAIWAVLYGHCRYVVLVAATADRGEELLESVKTTLRFNDLLWADFKRELHAIRALEGEPRRCKGQTFNGVPTQIEWGADKIVFPTVPGSLASGAIMTGCGLTGGEIRGQFHTGVDGITVIRPDMALIDDPQTRATAKSKTQTTERVQLLNGDVLGMAGPDSTRGITAMAAVTVIEPDDLAEQILDHDISPNWQGERMQMLYEWPTAEELWDEYAEIQRGSLKNGGDGSEATEFYREHQDEMDAGAAVAWPARTEGRWTGLQLAMDLCFRNRAAFMAEFQNDPEKQDDDTEKLCADDVVAKVNGLDRRRISEGREKITCHVDIHDKLLYWTVCAWSQGFTGEVIDYGTWPKQRSRHFAMRNVRTTMQTVAGGPDLDAAILDGLRKLTGELLGRAYQRVDGASMFIDVLGIDIGYKDYLVRQLLQISPHAARIQPMKGAGIGPENKPIREYRRGKGIVIGEYWWTPPIRGTNQIRHIHVDTNHWKSFIHRHFAIPLGGRGCLSLWGSPREREQHRYWAEMIADSEYFERTEGRGRVVDVWALHTNKPDNHAFDNVVGCAVLASKLGITDSDMPARPARQKVKLSEVQKQKRQQRQGASHVR